MFSLMVRTNMEHRIAVTHDSVGYVLCNLHWQNQTKNKNIRMWE